MLPRDPHEPRLLTWIRNPAVRRTLTLSGLWLFIFGVLISFRNVLLPFGLAILIAFIIEPVVQWATERSIQGKHMPRVAAILTIYVLVGVFIYVFSALTLPQIGREVAKMGAESTALISGLEGRMGVLLDETSAFAERNNLPIERAEIAAFLRDNMTAATKAARKNAAQVLTFGRDVIALTVQAIFGLFLVLMLTAFISIDRVRIVEFFASLVPPEYQASYDRMIEGISTGLAGVVRGQVLICMTNGVLTFIGLWLLGVKFPIVLATVAAMLSLIPIFGSILSTIPIVLVAITDSIPKGFLALFWIIGIHLVEANFLNPKIMGDAAKIHPVLVVFSLIVGEKTAGLAGALFAVPIASVVFTIFKAFHRRAVEAKVERARTDSMVALITTTQDLPRVTDPKTVEITSTGSFEKPEKSKRARKATNKDPPFQPTPTDS